VKTATYYVNKNDAHENCVTHIFFCYIFCMFLMTGSSALISVDDLCVMQNIDIFHVYIRKTWKICW